jgi:hypothetical protein
MKENRDINKGESKLQAIFGKERAFGKDIINIPRKVKLI